MPVTAKLGDCQAILLRIQQDTAKRRALPSPFKGASCLTIFRKTVEDGRKLLPVRYQKPYVDVLAHTVKQAEETLRKLGPGATSKRKAVFQQLELIFSALGSAIVQLKSHNYSHELRAFQAVISDVYKHFTDSIEVRTATKSPLLWPSLDPLGSLNSDTKHGPHTYAASPELPVALISKPVSHAACLPLWLIDGHEVGGHSIFTAVDNFLPELADAVEQGIRATIQTNQAKLSTNIVRFETPSGNIFGGRTSVSITEFMTVLWRSWLHEACADAAGVLNMGPMFVNGLILSLALDRPNLELSSTSVYDARHSFVEHPTDLVRALLSVEMLKHLGISRASYYAKIMSERLHEIQLHLPDELVWVNRNGSTSIKVRRKDMECVLPAVAQALLKAHLPCLAGKSLLEIMPWTAEDEKAVRFAAAGMLKQQPVAHNIVQARHIVSGAMLAFESASTSAQFAKCANSIHSSGLMMLNDIYLNQCLLCNAPTTTTQAKDPSQVTLNDLVRLVHNLRGD